MHIESSEYRSDCYSGLTLGWNLHKPTLVDNVGLHRCRFMQVPLYVVDEIGLMVLTLIVMPDYLDTDIPGCCQFVLELVNVFISISLLVRTESTAECLTR